MRGGVARGFPTDLLATVLESVGGWKRGESRNWRVLRTGRRGKRGESSISCIWLFESCYLGIYRQFYFRGRKYEHDGYSLFLMHEYYVLSIQWHHGDLLYGLYVSLYFKNLSLFYFRIPSSCKLVLLLVSLIVMLPNGHPGPIQGL